MSSDTVGSHKKFAGHHNLSFPLLSDSDGMVRKAYGVPSTLGFLPGRVTYVIVRQGVVRSIFDSQTRPEQHITEALGALGTGSRQLLRGIQPTRRSDKVMAARRWALIIFGLFLLLIGMSLRCRGPT